MGEIDVRTNQEEIVVSICCITYNHAKFVKYALEGFLMQKTNFRYEIIIHDDASTDNTKDIIEKYKKKYPDLIRTIYQSENQYSQGKPFIENTFEIAKGKYLAICEGDDYWIDEKKLQKQVDFLEKNLEYSATYHNVVVVDKNNRWNKQKQYIYPLFKEHDLKKEMIEKYRVSAQTASIVCRNFWKNFDDEDKQNFIKCKANGDAKFMIVFIFIGKIKYLENMMSCYRFITEEGDSWSAKNLKKNHNLLYYNSKIELKKMVYNIFKQNFNPSLDRFLLEAFIVMLKKPNKENLKIFCAILNKNKNKAQVLIRLIPEVANRIAVKLKISSKKQNFSRPLLEKIDISDEVINGK